MGIRSRIDKAEQIALAREAQAFEAWLQSLPEDRARVLCEDACSSLAQMGLLPLYSVPVFDLPEEERMDLANRLRAMAGRDGADQQGLELTRKLWRLHQQPEDRPE